MPDPTTLLTAPALDDALADEAEELDGYFSDAPLDPRPDYPTLNESLDNAIILTGLPKVKPEKLDKLIKVVTKTVARIGPLAITQDSNGLFMPLDEQAGTTAGVCLVVYEKAEHAKTAVQVLQGFEFDKRHTLAVTLLERAKALSQDQSLVSTSDSFEPPQPPPFTEPPRAVAWMEDENQRDSFVVRHSTETVVHWWDAKQPPSVDYDGYAQKKEGQLWCEYYCHWSPQGSYLATLVPARGVILWSGPKYEKVGRFVAPGVRTVLFSPKENYLLTNNMDPRDPQAIKVYEIATGKLLRAFALFPTDKQPTKVDAGAEGPTPPAFSWSYDDQYLARQGLDLITIFETPGMRLLDQRSLQAPGICDFQWSPCDNILAFWAPEANNSPAHVDLIELPSRKFLRQKNLFNVTACQMVWHPQGDYLAVKVTRHTKSKKTFYNNIELFRLRSPGVPVEMLEMKDAVLALQWEPRGSRFAMIHAENPQATKVKVSFYDMLKAVEKQRQAKKSNKMITYIEKVPELNLVETLEGRQCNVIFWSPAGTNIIMASLGDTASGTLEFYDVDSKTLVVKEHYRANQVLWDPAGRSVATIVSQPIEGGHFKFAMDNGYILWSFQGKQLYQESFETFYMFAWRPRPNLLSAQEIKKVERNLKKYEEEFERADREREYAARLEETRGKRMERARVREIIQRNKAIRQRYRAEHIELLGGYDSEDDQHYEILETTIPTVLSTKEETVM